MTYSSNEGNIRPSTLSIVIEIDSTLKIVAKVDRATQTEDFLFFISDIYPDREN